MSQHDPEQVEDLMVEVARTDPDPGVKEAAVFWLSQVGTESALDALADILQSSDEPGLQENAIFALAQHPSGRAADILKTYALDSSRPERVREKAIFWLGQQRDADPQLLIDLYGQLGSPGLKEQVFMALSQGDDERSTGWILERALDQSEDIDLRKQALFWAGQRRSVNLDRLQGLYARLTDVEMKEQLIFLYAHRPEEAAVDRLIEIARSEEDRELRKKAIFWLGQTRDERAIAFLLELVGDPL
jgi:HEAT repeat protein